MSVDNYLQRYAHQKSWIKDPPKTDTDLIVVIPAYNETSLIPSLESLNNCYPPRCIAEVIIVINEPENTSDKIRTRNNDCYEEAQKWIEKNKSPSLDYFVIFSDNLPSKDHGVGLARKIGMDEALRRFNYLGNITKGIIVCFDADSICTPNHLVAIHEHFLTFSKCPCISIYFEHPLDEIKDKKLLSGIIQYELHLRYYIHAQRFAGFPNAFHAVGSSMAVRADAYWKQGGMNKRKAGEDFYFFHKIINLGNVMELNNTSVIPSPRASERVPFGTGRAISDWMTEDKNTYFTYNPKSFVAAQGLFRNLKNIYLGHTQNDSYPECLDSFLKQEYYTEKLDEIKSKTADYSTFEKRFYAWFNSFKMMKYVHYCRDNYFENIPVTVAAKWLLEHHHNIDISNDDPQSLLENYRKLDRLKSE